MKPVNEIWMGPKTARLPVVVYILDQNPDALAESVAEFVKQYPAGEHGTKSGPVTKSVTGIVFCAIALIPAKGCDISKWGLLAQSE